MKIYIFFFAGISFLLSAFCCQAQSTSPSADVLKKIKAVENSLAAPIGIEGDNSWNILDRMNYYKLNGVSVAVIRNYKIEWAKGYGFSDDSSKTPVTTQTLFQAASVSKSLNGVGVLRLVQMNKLDIYADINQYLTSWKFPYDSISGHKKISTINLLSHTAGLNVHGFEGYTRNVNLPTLIQILNGTAPANSEAIRSVSEPDIRSEYSGGGITISQLIVQDITHESYARFMNEEILKPLGMTASSFTQPNPGNPALLATGYRMNGDEVSGKYHIYPEEAAAGLWTNPTDLSKYIIETQLALEGKSNKVLDQKMTRLRLTPYLDKHAALGVFIDDPDSTKYFQHGGSNEGFRCQYYGSLEGGSGLVVMVNSDNGMIIPEIINGIAKVYNLKGLYSTKTKKIVIVDSLILETYTGKYTLTPQLVLTITREKGNLFIEGTNQPRFQLYPESQTKFFVTQFEAELEFARDSSGLVSKVILYQNGSEKEAPKERPQ